MPSFVDESSLRDSDGHGFDPADRPQWSGCITSNIKPRAVVSVLCFSEYEPFHTAPIHMVGPNGWTLCRCLPSKMLHGIDASLWGHEDFWWCPICDVKRLTQDRAAETA